MRKRFEQRNLTGGGEVSPTYTTPLTDVEERGSALIPEETYTGMVGIPVPKLGDTILMAEDREVKCLMAFQNSIANNLIIRL